MSVFLHYPSPADYMTVLLYSVSVRFYNNDQKQVWCLLNHSGTLNLVTAKVSILMVTDGP